jgi:hypothetical protein
MTSLRRFAGYPGYLMVRLLRVFFASLAGVPVRARPWTADASELLLLEGCSPIQVVFVAFGPLLAANLVAALLLFAPMFGLLALMPAGDKWQLVFLFAIGFSAALNGLPEAGELAYFIDRLRAVSLPPKVVLRAAEGFAALETNGLPWRFGWSAIIAIGPALAVRWLL